MTPNDDDIGLVDATDEVNELKDKINDLLDGKNMAVIAMALGALLGEKLEEETLNYVLEVISNLATRLSRGIEEDEEDERIIN